MAQTAAEKKSPTVKVAKAAPKKPADRKAKGETKIATRPEEVRGWDLLKSFEEIPVWDQMPLIKLLDDATADASTDLSKEEYAALTPEERKEMKEGKRTSIDITILGDLALKLKDFAVDEEAYVKFCSGSGAMQRAIELAMAWVGQMGEAISSENS